MAATRAEIQSPDPSSWGVIQRLCANESETTRTVGFALRDLVETGLGSVVAGPPSGLSSLTTNPGLWVVQMPGLTLPSPESAPESWSPIERVGMACLRGCLAWMIRTTGRREFRGRSKVVIVPEVHLLTKTPDGASFLDYIARVGRALGASLVLDTQDPASILKLPGLVEQITTLFAFSLRSREQVDSLLELLGRPQTAPYQALVRGINTAANGKSIRHGHCIVRDRWDEVATVQIDLPSQQVAALLRTTPESDRDEVPAEPVVTSYEEPDPFADDYEDEEAARVAASRPAATEPVVPQPPLSQPAVPQSAVQEPAVQEAAPRQSANGQAAPAHEPTVPQPNGHQEAVPQSNGYQVTGPQSNGRPAAPQPTTQQAVARQPSGSSVGGATRQAPAGQYPTDQQAAAPQANNSQDRHHATRYDEPIGPVEVYDQEADEAAYNEAMYNGYESGEQDPGEAQEGRDEQRHAAGKKEHVA